VVLPGDDQSTMWDRWAPFYDTDIPADPYRIEQTVDRLIRLADQGPVLELGIGSGRLALPLSEKGGFPVVGVDSSPAMLAELDKRRGRFDAQVEGRLGDMASFELAPGETFALVYIASSTLFLLTRSDQQESCLRRAADALAPDGLLAIEAAMPATLINGGRSLAVRAVTSDGVRISALTHDPVEQIVSSQEICLQQDGTFRMLPSMWRYFTPAELDLMARFAGLALVNRTEDWAGTPFTAHSGHHVSVYARQDDRQG
jgi:SAM-dependent methyltransferase